MIDRFFGEYRFLSNFWPVQIRMSGIVYPSVEHAYQAAKTLDVAQRETISGLSVVEAKRYGKTVTMRPDWQKIKLEVMRQLVAFKFKQEPLKTMLLSTGDEELVEGNNWGDTYWGICRGRGENHLGKILMQIRKEIE